MKRIIDLLTLLTLVLAILATSWSIDSFGQASSWQTEMMATLKLDSYVVDDMQNQTRGEISEAISGQVRETDIEPMSSCQTFEFLGDPYFKNPEDHYADSCIVSQRSPGEYFQFMGDYYPELPEEAVKLNYTY